jgi:hypothetical protein
MKIVFDAYEPTERIEVLGYLKNKKLVKYFNRETEAAIAGMNKLLNGLDISRDTPFYYATGLLEYQDYGLHEIVKDSVDIAGNYSEELFIDKGLMNISPLNQFKVLQNMPLSFVSIEFSLKGDNAVIYSSAYGLLEYAKNSPSDGLIIIGAGKVYKNGKAEAGFCLLNKSELENLKVSDCDEEAIEIFKRLSIGGAQ